jgi:general secretion pathway protein C
MWFVRLRNRFVVGATVVTAFSVSSYFFVEGCLFLLRGPADPIRRESSFVREPAGPTSVPDGAKDAEALGRAILRRNIFDSATGPLRWRAPLAPRSGVDAGSIEKRGQRANVMPCDASMKLVGHVLNDARPESTLALVRISDEAQVLGVGDKLLESTLVALTPTHAFFSEPSGTTCSLYLFAKSPGRKPTASGVATKSTQRSSSKKRQALSEEDYAGLTKVAEGEYRVKSALINKVLGQRANLTRGLRFVPHPRRGHTRGLRIYGIRKGSLLHRLGLHNGDVLRTLNGFPLATANGVLEAYGQLKSRDRLDIAYFHRGRPKHVNLHVE